MESSLVQTWRGSAQFAMMKEFAWGTMKNPPEPPAPDARKQVVFNAHVIETANILRSRDGVTNVSVGPIDYHSDALPIITGCFVCQIRFDMLGVPMWLSLCMYEDSDEIFYNTGMESPSDFLNDLQREPQEKQEFAL